MEPIYKGLVLITMVTLKQGWEGGVVRGDVRGGISTCVDPCSINQSGIWLTVTIYRFMTIPLTKAN